MQKTREVPAAHNLLSEHFPLTAEVRKAIQELLGDNTPEPPDIFAIRSKVKELMQSLPSPAQTKSSLEILAATDYLTRLSEIYGYCPHLQEGEFIPFDVDLSPFQSRMRDLGTR